MIEMRRDRKASTIEYKQLMKILEIAEPEEFEYFENMADLIECEYTISDAAIANLFRYVDGETLAELIENYFSDILEHLPENQDEIYLLINNIGMNLIGLAKGKEEEEEHNLAVLAEEFNKFKMWYLFDTEVVCEDPKYGETLVLPVAEAIAEYRSEPSTKKKSVYNFEQALNYQLSDYVMSFGELVAAEYAEDSRHYNEDEEYDYGHHHHHDHDCGCGHEHHHDPDDDSARVVRKEGLAYGFADESVLADGFVYDDEI